MNGEAWSTLGIEPTGEEREIRRAYARRLLKEQRPEEDSQAFQELRNAYEAALHAAPVRRPERP